MRKRIVGAALLFSLMANAVHSQEPQPVASLFLPIDGESFAVFGKAEIPKGIPNDQLRWAFADLRSPIEVDSHTGDPMHLGIDIYENESWEEWDIPITRRPDSRVIRLPSSLATYLIKKPHQSEERAEVEIRVVRQGRSVNAVAVPRICLEPHTFLNMTPERLAQPNKHREEWVPFAKLALSAEIESLSKKRKSRNDAATQSRDKYQDSLDVLEKHISKSRGIPIRIYAGDTLIKGHVTKRAQPE